MRPERHARIGILDFQWITADLFTIEEFANECMQIDKLMFGNRGFRLFDDKGKKIKTIDQMVGLKLPETVECAPEDRRNLATLVSLLKKTKTLQLDRINVTWPILKVVIENEA